MILNASYKKCGVTKIKQTNIGDINKKAPSAQNSFSCLNERKTH